MAFPYPLPVLHSWMVAVIPHERGKFRFMVPHLLPRVHGGNASNCCTATEYVSLCYTARLCVFGVWTQQSPNRDGSGRGFASRVSGACQSPLRCVVGLPAHHP